jgi:hypothetical protein
MMKIKILNKLFVIKMPSASAMSASVCLISSLSSGGSGLGKPGGKRGSLLTASLLAWFELLLLITAHKQH